MPYTGKNHFHSVNRIVVFTPLNSRIVEDLLARQFTYSLEFGVPPRTCWLGALMVSGNRNVHEPFMDTACKSVIFHDPPTTNLPVDSMIPTTNKRLVGRILRHIPDFGRTTTDRIDRVVKY